MWSFTTRAASLVAIDLVSYALKHIREHVGLRRPVAVVPALDQLGEFPRPDQEVDAGAPVIRVLASQPGRFGELVERPLPSFGPVVFEPGPDLRPALRRERHGDRQADALGYHVEGGEGVLDRFPRRRLRRQNTRWSVSFFVCVSVFVYVVMLQASSKHARSI